MNNVLLDALPDCWESPDGKSYKLDTDFRIGIQICLLQADPDLSDREKLIATCDLLFEWETPERPEDIEAAIHYFIEGWTHDKPGKREEKKRLMDFDIDQWRIYAAFLMAYRIDLSTAGLHWWAFMGLLSALPECAYTRVIDIRSRKFKPKMSSEDRKALRDAKSIYELDEKLTHEEAAFVDEMDELLGVSAGEKKRIEDFEKYGK